MEKNIIFIMFFLSLGLISSAPLVSFVSPTPDDGNTTTLSYTEMNVSVVESNINSFIWNWNGTNYTIYNSSVVLMLNFNNKSSLGENDTLAVDLSIYENNATLSGGATWNSTGKYNGAFEFDGNNDITTISSDTSLENQNFTLCFWARLNNYAATLQGGVGKGASSHTSATNQEFALEFHNNLAYFTISNGSSLLIETYSIGDANWHHWCGQVNGSAILLFKDGSATGSPVTRSTGFGDISYSNHRNFYISQSAYPFNGSIDELVLYNRSLSSTEIQEVYSSNLYKYNSTHLYFYINQSLGSSLGPNKFFTYRALVINSSNSLNQTESRNITRILDNTLFLVYPINYTLFQRHNSTHGEMKIIGNYSGGITSIQAKFGIQDWITINSSLSDDGTFISFLNVSVNQTTLYIRAGNNNSINDSKGNISIGDLYVIAGQSNALGRATNAQNLNNSNLYFSTVYRDDDSWLVANDPIHVATSSGTPFPLLANYIIQNQSVPISFVATAVGGTHISVWQKGQTYYDRMYDQIVEATNGTMKVKGLLYHQGEEDTYTGVEYSDYKNSLINLSRDFLNDTSIAENVIVAQIGHCYSIPATMNRSSIDNIRKAQVDSWNEDENVSVGPNLYDIGPLADKVHFQTDSEIQALAQRWWASIGEIIYNTGDGRGPRIINITMNEGDNDTIVLNFTETSLPLKIEYWNGTTHTKSQGFYFTLENGTSLGDELINSTSVINQYQLQINLTLNITSGMNITFGGFNDGVGKPIVRDSSTYSLPSETFYNHSIFYIKTSSGASSSSSTSTNDETSSGNPTFSPSVSQLENGYNNIFRKNTKVNVGSNIITIIELHEGNAVIGISDKEYSIDENETIKIDTNNDGYYDLQINAGNVNEVYANLTIKTIYEEIPAEEKEGVIGNIVEGTSNILDENKWIWILIGVVGLGVLIFAGVKVLGKK